MSKTQSQIEAEIGEMAEKMAKSTKDSKQLLFDTIMELGPEGLKKALPDLSEEEREVLKTSLDEMAKSRSEDAEKLTPKKDLTSANEMKQESFEGSDDEDEKKLMADKNKEQNQQGGPKDKPEGWEGQVIKAIEQSEDLVKALFNDKCQIVEAVKSDETKESVMNQISWRVEDLKRMKEMSWLVSDELPEIKEMMEKKFSKIKSEIKGLAEKFSSLKKSKEDPKEKEAVKKLIEIEEAEHKVDIDGDGKVAEKLEKDKDMKKSLEEIVVMAKSLGMSKEDIVKAVGECKGDLELTKGKMKEMIADKEAKAKAPSALEAIEDAVEKDGKEEKPEEKKDEPKKIEKSVSWTPKSSIAANTLGRNTHWDVDAYIVKSEEEKQDTIKKGAYFNDVQGETLQKSQTEKADINDLIAKGMDYSTDEIKRIEGVRDHKVEGTLVKSFHDIEIAKAMGMSEEEYKKLMGE